MLLAQEDASSVSAPAETPFINIKYKNFTDLWVKDESCNRTGTHKDRIANSLIKLYRHYLNAIKGNAPLPACSLISAGNAALAIGHLFNVYNLPKLKVLLDKCIDPRRMAFLRDNHCEVYEANIFSKPLTTKDILKLTNNVLGIDITSYSLLDKQQNFYNCLCEDVLKMKPHTVIMPYGSGGLFEGFCTILRKSPLITSEPVNIIGVTTKNHLSKADKLFSAYAPFDYNEERLHLFKTFGFVGPQSEIYNLEEDLIDEAMALFKLYNIQAEHSGVVGLGYLIKHKTAFSSKDRIIIINTGKGLFEQKQAKQ